MRIIDLSDFNNRAQAYFDKQNNRDRNIWDDGLTIYESCAAHVGLLSTWIGGFILVISGIFWEPFPRNETPFFCLIELLFLFIGAKYVLGGFGFNGIFMTTVKLLLSFALVYVYYLWLGAPNGELELFNNGIRLKFQHAQVLTFVYLILGGLLTGVYVATFVRHSTRGTEGMGSFIYNRFVAGFNSGVFFGACLLVFGAAIAS